MRWIDPKGLFLGPVVARGVAGFINAVGGMVVASSGNDNVIPFPTPSPDPDPSPMPQPDPSPGPGGPDDGCAFWRAELQKAINEIKAGASCEPGAKAALNRSIRNFNNACASATYPPLKPL